jgi:hypothetical protein
MSGIISGRVVDAAGAPVQGATVAITAGPGPVSDIASRTDANGHFEIGNLEPGTYSLDVRLAGQASLSVKVEVVDGQRSELVIRPGDQQAQPGELEVQLDLSNIDWSQVRLVRVALDYASTDPANATGKDFVLTSTNHAIPAWQVPLSDSRLDQYTYKVEYFMADGTRRTVLPTPSNNRTLVLDPQS